MCALSLANRIGLDIHCWAARLGASKRQGHSLILMFDFDGTLAPHCSHPALSRIPRRLGETLHSLAGKQGVYLGVLSSRPLKQLEYLIDFPTLILCGSGGREIRIQGLTMIDPYLFQDQATVERIAENLDLICQKVSGSWVEIKPGCLCLHFREVAKRESAKLTTEVRDTVAQLAPDWNTMEVGYSLEIVPQRAWDKCQAAKIAISSVPESAEAFYVGDGPNDESAIRYVNKIGGVTVGLGRGSPEIASHFEATTGTLAQGLKYLDSQL
jgi:trehalose-phosphatase